MDSYTEVYTWGSNSYGQMGLEASKNYFPIPRICSFGVLIIQVSCGNDHSAFLSTQHYIYTMGSNSDGKLGIDDKSLACSSFPLLVESLVGCKITQISCGGSHSSAVSHEGDLYTWGKGAMTGHGDLVTRWSPEKVDLDCTYVLQVSCGHNHSGAVGIRNTERVCLTWGYGESGQLGIGSKENLEKPDKASISDVKEVACGEDFTIFLDSQGRVFTCGKGNSGQLGLGSLKDALLPTRVKTLDHVYINKIAAGGLAGCLTEDGNLLVWGLGTVSPMQIRGCPKDLIDLNIGKRFLTVISRTSSIWSWGNNHHGQLGIGDLEEKDSICLVAGLNKKKARLAACGSDFVIVLGEDLKSPKNLSIKIDKSPEKSRETNDNLNSPLDDENKKSLRKEHRKSSREQFWSSERNEIRDGDAGKEAKDLSLYDSALRKMNQLLVQKEKQLQVEKELRMKNERYRKIYVELEEKLASVVKSIEIEKLRREELEIGYTKKESRLLSIIREKDEEVAQLKMENSSLRKKLDNKKPCTTCFNILTEFNALKEKNESLLFELSKKNTGPSTFHSKKPTKDSAFSPNTSGLYVPQSPSFDKSLDKSMDRHKMINNQLKFSRSESELLKLIDTTNNVVGKSPGRTDRSNEQHLHMLNMEKGADDEFALPTFRNRENSFSMQKNLKNSLADIKARITALNSNRSELQTKMEVLEMKLLHSPSQNYDQA